MCDYLRYSFLPPGVFGGLDLHGVEREVTWTKLATTVVPGDTSIHLAEETGWEVDDEIVVTTTSYETWQTETFVILEKTDKFNFKLNSSFQYSHIGKYALCHISDVVNQSIPSSSPHTPSTPSPPPTPSTPSSPSSQFLYDYLWYYIFHQVWCILTS